jgi:nicotinate-nucleotide adenylyltransferase
VLGGSFNPAHEGHRHVAGLALQRLRLDQVWLMVSPGNPLKSSEGMASLADRMNSARGIGDGRRIVATAIESHLHTRYTYDTLRVLRQRFPLVRFIWVMGADNLVQLPRWQHWTGIARTMPFAVMPRPTYNQRALAGQAAQRLRPALRDAREAPVLSASPTPAWTFLPARQNPASATAIRELGKVEPQFAWPPPPQELQRTPVLATTRA